MARFRKRSYGRRRGYGRSRSYKRGRRRRSQRRIYQKVSRGGIRL